MRYVGVTRFSIFSPNSKAWRASSRETGVSEEEYKRRLFAPERLDPRMDIFVNVSLPQIAAAVGEHEVTHIVSYSPELPQQYQEELQAAERRYDFMRLSAVTAAGWEINPLTVGQSAAGLGGTFGLYRLDDDDLLPIDYFDRMAQYVVPALQGYRVSFPAGYTGIFEQGQYSELRQTYQPMVALGILAVCGVKHDGSIHQPPDAPHINSDRFGPVILDAREPGFLLTRHTNQDTHFNTDPTQARLALLRDLQGLSSVTDMAQLQRLFPHLHQRVRQPTLHRLFDGLIPLDTKLAFTMPPAAGSFSIQLEIEAGEEATAKNALVALDLVDSVSEPVSASITIPGLTFSDYNGIGFCRYLNLRPGHQDLSASFVLPDGVTCKGVSIHRWLGNGTQLNVRSVSLAVT